jgi:hypothetical protein
VYSKKSLEYFLKVNCVCILLQSVLAARGYMFSHVLSRGGRQIQIQIVLQGLEILSKTILRRPTRNLGSQGYFLRLSRRAEDTFPGFDREKKG